MSRECPTGGGGGDGGACRKCGEEGHFAADCSQPDKCFRCKQEGHKSNECELPETCFKCKKEGHRSADCELPDTCRKCKQEGHMARDCELPDVCRNCGEEGHMSKDCSKPQVCKRCGEEGHMVRECSQEEKTRQMTDEEGKIREIYVPKEEIDDSKLFESAITSGINFSKFENIPVKVTGENPPAGIKSFSSAGLRPLLLENITKSGYKVPTPVQKLCLPIIMSGRDLMSCAQTGSGKTAAFLLPILHKLMEGQADNHAGEMVQAPQCVVITPTRELAMQIKDEARKFSMGSMMRCVVAYGGTSVGYQLGQLQKGCNVLICTPGRMMDFVEKGKVSFENLKYLVLDEADRMLDMGFMPDIERAIGHDTMPAKGERQTLMFSATFPDEIQKTAQEFLTESYLFVTVGVIGGACADVVQEFHEVSKFDKREKLTEILQSCDPKDKTLVFVKTKKNADFIATHLSGEGLPTTSIHGDRFQREREEALYDFRTGAMPILVATAVAARGLDIKGVAHVVNFDMPEDIDEYVHRIGRTGRVGNLGKATSFYDSEEDSGIAGTLVKILAECGQEVPDWLAEASANAPADGEKGDDAAAGGDDDEDWG